jgi:hypothetical protein
MTGKGRTATLTVHGNKRDAEKELWLLRTTETVQLPGS